MKGTPCSKAIQNWEAANNGASAAEAEVVKLIFQMPPIDKMDPTSLNTLVKCKQLSLSSNSIDKMINLPSLKYLEILSLSRNNIKKISGLDEIGQTLQQLWLSYNQIERLDNLQACVKLNTLFISNNKIKNWDEVDKLKELPEISNVLFVTNPMYEGLSKEDARNKILAKISTLKFVDGQLIDQSMVDKALGA